LSKKTNWRHSCQQAWLSASTSLEIWPPDSRQRILYSNWGQLSYSILLWGLRNPKSLHSVAHVFIRQASPWFWRKQSKFSVSNQNLACEHMTSADPGSNGNPVVRSVHLERSSFDITVVGTADPQPTKFEPLPTRLHCPKQIAFCKKHQRKPHPPFLLPSSTTTTTTTKHNHRHLKKERSCKHIKQPNTLRPSQQMQLLLLVQLLSCYSLSIWSCSGYIYRRSLSMRSLHRKRGEEEEEEA